MAVICIMTIFYFLQLNADKSPFQRTYAAQVLISKFGIFRNFLSSMEDVYTLSVIPLSSNSVDAYSLMI